MIVDLDRPFSPSAPEQHQPAAYFAIATVFVAPAAAGPSAGLALLLITLVLEGWSGIHLPSPVGAIFGFWTLCYAIALPCCVVAGVSMTALASFWRPFRNVWLWVGAGALLGGVPLLVLFGPPATALGYLPAAAFAALPGAACAWLFRLVMRQSFGR